MPPLRVRWPRDGESHARIELRGCKRIGAVDLDAAGEPDAGDVNRDATDFPVSYKPQREEGRGAERDRTENDSLRARHGG